MWSNKDSMAIHLTGIRPWKRRHSVGGYWDSRFGLAGADLWPASHLAPLHVGVFLVHISGEAEVRDLHLPALGHQDVTRSEVSVDELTSKTIVNFSVSNCRTKSCKYVKCYHITNQYHWQSRDAPQTVTEISEWQNKCISLASFVITPPIFLCPHH